MRQALNVTATDCVSNDREDDRDGAGDLQQCGDGTAGMSQYNVGTERDQFRRVPQGLSARPAVVNANVLTHGPTELLETLRKRCKARLCFRIITESTINTPMRFILCCARTVSGHAATEPPIRVMNSRRLMSAPGVDKVRS
jgi:hypothetical protein